MLGVRWPSEWNRDAWQDLASYRVTAARKVFRLDSHQFEEPFHFLLGNPDPALPLGASLQVLDHHAFAADFQQPVVRLSQPVVQRGHRNPEALSAIFRQ